MSELELQLQASLASTHNGSFLWRIPEVARRRRDAIDERITSIYSPPFYSGRFEHKEHIFTIHPETMEGSIVDSIGQWVFCLTLCRSMDSFLLSISSSM